MGGAGAPRGRSRPRGARGRERFPGELGASPHRPAPAPAQSAGCRVASAPAGRGRMTRLTPLAGWASGRGLSTAPLTRRRASRSLGDLRGSAPGLAGRRGTASLTPLSLDPTDRLEARPRGACPGRTRESSGPDLQSDRELAHTESKWDYKDKFPPRLGQNQFSSPCREMLASSRPRISEVW